MQIVDALFTAQNPRGLAAWYERNVGAAPRFIAGVAAPHHFAFHVESLEPWRTRLDVTEEHDFADWDGARAVYFRDPELNIVEFLARPHARPHLSLAEIGLPVANVPAAVEALAGLGIEPYKEWDENFAPLGNADGLLIVVRVGRGWMPYDEPAGAAAIEVTVAGVSAGELTLPGSGHRIIST